MYNRELEDTIKELNKTWSIVSVTGPRQSGKTTLCKMSFPNYAYVNLEHIPTRNRIENDIDGFLDLYPNGLIIDEAQNMPDLFSYLQVRVDLNKKLRYIISGSSDFLMMQGISQSLAGRVSVKRLLPLSLSELSGALDFTTDELMFRGFYPGVWGDGKLPKDVYESYYETYLDKDVRQIVNIQNLSAFRKFVTVCAGRIGSEFNASNISREVGISNQTVSNWMSILETSYTAFRLLPYYRNINKRLTKVPKIYFYDVGFACWILGIRNTNDLATHPLRGNLFENMVVVEMMKNQLNKGDMPNLYFYRDRTQHEVDILHEEGLKLECYEVKSGKTYISDWNNNLNYLQKLMPDSIVSTKVVYDGLIEQNTAINGLINYRNLLVKRI